MAAELSRDTPSVDLHGLTKDAAESELDVFLNREFMGGSRAVRIVHGKGTGVLKLAVEETLAHHPLVMQWRNSEKRGGGKRGYLRGARFA